jgi:hypothetical protein
MLRARSRLLMDNPALLLLEFVAKAGYGKGGVKIGRSYHALGKAALHHTLWAKIEQMGGRFMKWMDKR